MVGVRAAEGLIFRTASTLVAYEVWIGAAESCGACGLMGIHHDVMLGCLLDAIEVVVVHRLRIVMVATRDDIAYITRLHGIVAILIHERISFFKIALIVLCARGGLVVHEQLHAFRMSVVVEGFQVEVGIRSLEVEHIALPAVCPVLPSYVPTFHKHLVETVLGCEVDVAAHFLIRRTVAAIGSCLHPVDVVELHGGELIGVVPRRFTNNHLPPHTTILRGMNPRGVVQCTRVVEIEDEVRGKHVAGIVGDHHRAPRRLARCLHATFQARGIGGEM